MLKKKKNLYDILYFINIVFWIGDVALLFGYIILAKLEKWGKICIAVGYIIVVLYVVYLISLFLCIISYLIGLIRKAISIRYKCEDSIFDKLDCYLKTRNSNSNKEFIKILNYYYSEKGPVMKNIVYNNEIDRLYKRKDFLEKKINSWAKVVNCMLSSLLSIVLGYITSEQNDALLNIVNKGNMKLYISFWLVIFIGVILLFSNSMRGRLDSYSHYIYQYELQLLEQKIKQLEEKISFGDIEDVHIYEMRQFILAFLHNQFKRDFIGKKANQIQKEMKEIEDAKLENINQKNYVSIPFQDDDRLIYYSCTEYVLAYRRRRMDVDDGPYVIYKYIKKYEKELKKFYNKSIIN